MKESKRSCCMLCRTSPPTTQNLVLMRCSRLLEVGALKPDNYKHCTSWIHNTPIDLHARHPDIREQDFLLLDPGENKKWNAVSLSLVLNFVPESRDRGEQSDQCRFDLLNNMKGVCCTWLILSSRILDTSFLQFVLFYFFCPILTLTASLALCRQFTLYDI